MQIFSCFTFIVSLLDRIVNTIYNLYVIWLTSHLILDQELLYLRLQAIQLLVYYICLQAFISISIRCELNLLGTFINASNGLTYNRWVSSHGLGMVFLFIMPMLISFSGNLIIPQSFSILDFAIPRVNLMSYYLLGISGCVLILALSREEGIGTGWTVYVPLADSNYHSSSSINIAIVALHLLGLSSEGGAVTFLISVIVVRIFGVFLVQGCLLSWSILNASVLLVLTLPVLGSGITILLCDRLVNCVFYVGVGGGDPVVFQHLFWYFGHPEVYVIILPAFGVVSNTIVKLAQSSLASHLGMILALVSISLVGFFVWAHHMFVAGIVEESRLYFSSATMIIAIPTAMKIFTWLSSIYNVKCISNELIVVAAFLICFSIGGFTGLIISNSNVDILYHDTYYIVGHFHYVLSIAALLGCLLLMLMFRCALFCFGNVLFIRYGICLMLVGINWMFGLQHFVGIDGHPRRIFQSAEIHVVIIELSNFSIILIASIPCYILCSRYFAVRLNILSSGNMYVSKTNVVKLTSVLFTPILTVH